jgi:hypothetical protein
MPLGYEYSISYLFNIWHLACGIQKRMAVDVEICMCVVPRNRRLERMVLLWCS